MDNKHKQKQLKPAFETMLSRLKPVSKEHQEEATRIMQEDSLYDLFDFLIDIGCFPEKYTQQIRTYLGIELFNYETEENYSELDTEKYVKFLDAVQIKAGG